MNILKSNIVLFCNHFERSQIKWNIFHYIIYSEFREKIILIVIVFASINHSQQTIKKKNSLFYHTKLISSCINYHLYILMNQ